LDLCPPFSFTSTTIPSSRLTGEARREALRHSSFCRNAWNAVLSYKVLGRRLLLVATTMIARISALKDLSTSQIDLFDVWFFNVIP